MNGYSDFFNRIKKFEDKIPAKKVFRYINTHPLSDLRIENLKSYAEDQGYQLQGEKTPWKWEPTPNRQAP